MKGLPLAKHFVYVKCDSAIHVSIMAIGRLILSITYLVAMP